MRLAGIVNALEVADVLTGGMSAVFLDEFSDALNVFSSVGLRSEEGNRAAALIPTKRGWICALFF